MQNRGNELKMMCEELPSNGWAFSGWLEGITSIERDDVLPLRQRTIRGCIPSTRASATVPRNGRVMMMATACAKSIATVVKVRALVCARSYEPSEASTSTTWLTTWRPTKPWRMPNGSPRLLSGICVSATVCTLRPHEPRLGFCHAERRRQPERSIFQSNQARDASLLLSMTVFFL